MKRTFDHSGWWFLVLHDKETPVMKSFGEALVSSTLSPWALPWS